MTESSSHEMDSADPATSTPTLATLIAILEHHEQMFAHIRGELTSLRQAVAQLTPLPASPPATMSPPAKPAPTVSVSASTPTPVHFDRFLPTPRPFTGEVGKCAGFLTQFSFDSNLKRFLMMGLKLLISCSCFRTVCVSASVCAY